MSADQDNTDDVPPGAEAPSEPAAEPEPGAEDDGALLTALGVQPAVPQARSPESDARSGDVVTLPTGLPEPVEMIPVPESAPVTVAGSGSVPTAEGAVERPPGGGADASPEPAGGSAPDVGLSGSGLALVVGFWAIVSLIVVLASSERRSWLADHWGLIAILAGVAVVVLASSAYLVVRKWAKNWSRSRGASWRAALLLLIGYPMLALMLGSVFFVLPPEQQLVAMRVVVLVALSITPAVLWWLFLATQRASLLNEFIANLHRLGLLDAWCVGGHIETERARTIRISGYLQRFEATYGRMPARIHANVLSNSAEPYTEEDARESVPIATAAVPVFLSILVFSIGWLLTLPPIESFPPDEVEPRWFLALDPNTTPVTMTFLGAYFFSLQMLFRRYVRGDLRGSAYVAVVLRVVLAVIGVWVIEAAGGMSGWEDRSELLLIGFIIGVFPVVLWQIIRGMATATLQLVVPKLKEGLPLSDLDGLTVWHESRFEEEDIENIPNMATADIVDLMVNTRFPANRIIDWVDQAILLTHLGAAQGQSKDAKAAREVLASHGIRTASALLKAAHDAKAGKREFASLFSCPGQAQIENIQSSVRTSSNLALVLRWRGLEKV
jgi:hypothetical protein